MIETAYAKINLALHVRAREQDGFHRIETLFAFAEEGDRLAARDGVDLSLELTGPFGSELGAPDDNLVLRAARALRSRYGVKRGAALTLDKRLPVASGIGGGSADAAAALRLLCRLWRLPDDREGMLSIACSLGADVPACLDSRTVRGEARGDRLLPEDGSGLSGTPLLLVNPRVPLATAAVFAGWDDVDRGPLAAGLPLAAALAGRNDLEKPARVFVPAIEDLLRQLACAPGAILARMSGSGATCFALFASKAERDAAAADFAQTRDWWQLSTRLR